MLEILGAEGNKLSTAEVAPKVIAAILTYSCRKIRASTLYDFVVETGINCATPTHRLLITLK